MATLTGKITDVTGRSPDSISSITVKAPSARIGSGTDVIVSSPAEVTFHEATGNITISGLTGGLSWLYIEGDGWSDSIPLAVAEGMITLVEAIANAAGAPGLVDFIALVTDLQNRIDNIAQDAVDAAAENIRWDKPAVTNADTARTVGAHRTNADTTNLPANAASPFGSLEVLPSGSASISQRFTTWGSVIETWERNPISGASEQWVAWRLKPSRAELAEKADTSYVDTGLAEKADKSYVDTGLAEKADKSYVDNATHRIGVSSSDANKYVKLGATGRLFVSTGSITEAGDVTNKYYVDGQLASKADTTYVDSELAEKADTTYVESALGEKADTSYMESALAEKADTSTVDTIDSAVRSVQEVVEPIAPGRDDSFAVLDVDKRTALRVTPSGDVTIGTSTVKEGTAGFRVTDSDGRIALGIDASGRVTIPDLTTDTTESEIHVFLAAGQSNMQGFARPVGGDLDPINPRILQFGASSQKVETAPAILDNPGGQIGLSPARVFANEYLKTQPDHVRVLLVPYAWGGTGFNDGSGNGATWDDRQAVGEVRDLYTESVAQTMDAIAASENSQLKGILWHQGESNQNDTFEDYAAQLDRLIDNYRSDLGNTNLPFLIGQMTQEGFEVTPRKLIIDAAHQDTLRRKRYIGFAPSTFGSTNYNDTTHFSRRGVEHLGAEYVSAYFRALDNAPGFGPQQPVNVSAKFINGTLTITWEQQPRRVTGYRVEYRVDGGAWTEAVREYPMNLTEEVSGLSGTVAEVRVTCINLAQETTQLYPTIAPHIQY